MVSMNKKLEEVRHCDYFKLKRNPDPKGIQASVEEKSRREHYLFTYNYDPILPIVARREEIIQTIKDHQVLILAGETGSGKTTQIPKFCLEAGRGIEGKIACTQPRRIAALSVADRIAEELNDPLAVGVKIRFQDNDHPHSFIKLMTDGVLLAETQSDRWLNQYDTIIIDEAHERSLNIDFILGILKQLIQKRKDLKVIITSATIDTEKFSRAFDNAPIIEVSGRTYPVELRYKDNLSEDLSLAEQSWEAIEEILQDSGRGDVLVFLPTEQDIREAVEMGPGRLGRRQALILPLYARLPSQEQKRIFHSASERKIIFSTNIAETSLTIPGIRFVVDSGLARLARYSPGTGTFGLPVEAISQSSADQRKGRCGRVEEGLCIRLYSEEDFQGRSVYTAPEVLRTNLAEVILRMLHLGIQDISGFPFIDKPSSAGISDGYKTLLELRAIKKKGRGKNASYQMSSMGRKMARIPADPRLSRMLIQSDMEGCTREALVIMAALSIQDPREKLKGDGGKIAQNRAPLKDESSDFLTLLNYWKQWEKTSGSLMKRIKNFSKEYALSFRRFKEWLDLFQQFKQMAEEMSMDTREFKGKGEALSYALHRSILSGFLSHVSRKKDQHSYEATRNRQAYIFPGSALFKSGGDWLVSAEIIHTSKLFLRINAKIDSSWLLDLGEHLLQRKYLEPRWDEKSQTVMAREEIRIFGFLLKNEDWKPYGPVAPAEAREIFIQQALVEGMKHQAPAFLRKNRSLKQECLKIENKLRKRGLVDPLGETRFYMERCPQVSSLSELNLFLKNEGDKSLILTKDYLMTPDREEEKSNLPDYWEDGESRYKIRYQFTPGKEEDGPTLMVPKKKLDQWNPPEEAEILPQMNREKITAYLKGLPKELRKQLIPLARHVDLILQEMNQGEDETLESALAGFLFRKWRISAPAECFQKENLPAHIRLKYALVDNKGRVLKRVQDPRLLQQEKKSLVSDDAFHEWTRQKREMLSDGLKLDLPDQETHSIKGRTMVLYPSLHLEKDQCYKSYCLKKEDSTLQIKKAIPFLVLQYYRKELQGFKKEMSLSAFKNLIVHFPLSSEWIDHLWLRAAEELFFVVCRKGEEFRALIREKGGALYEKGQEWMGLLQQILEHYTQWREYLKNVKTVKLSHLKEYLKEREQEGEAQLSGAFLLENSREDLQDLPRFYRCLKARTEKGLLDLPLDKARQEEWDQFYLQGKDLEARISPHASENRHQAQKDFDRLLKEYYYALFCQSEKRKVKVSPKRLKELLMDMERMI